MNVKQANGLGRVHVAKPGMKETYCGRPIDEDDWITTSNEANCTGCARAGAPCRSPRTHAARKAIRRAGGSPVSPAPPCYSGPYSDNSIL